MISLLSDPFKVESNYNRPVQWLIENYFDCIYGYILDDGYVRDYKGGKPTYNKNYTEYIINSYSDTYFNFTQSVNLLSLITGDKDLPEIDKSKIKWEDEVHCCISLPYIFSLLTKQNITFYEIDTGTYQGKKTTILLDGNITTINLQLIENAPKTN